MRDAQAARESVRELFKRATAALPATAVTSACPGGWPAPGRSWVRRHELEQQFKNGQIGYADLIKSARAGDLDADDALRDRLMGYLVKLPENKLPAALRDWAMRTVFKRQVGGRREGKKGRKPSTNRDLLICMMVQHAVTTFELPATKNRESKGPAACSIVAEVVCELGLNIREAAVAKIWEHRHAIFPTSFPPS
jgi:hypothetical protein